MLVFLCLYGAATREVPLAGFGWAMATHLSMYPVFLLIPIAFLLANGADSPPRKLFKLLETVDSSTERNSSYQKDGKEAVSKELGSPPSSRRKWVVVAMLVLWSAISWVCILRLCKLARQGRSSLVNM